jgi:hypothetical protein
MLEADGIVFASPECNYGPSGVLKNAIDWLSRMTAQPFAAKPTAMFGASGGVLGTARAQYQLRQIMVFLDGRPINKPEVMIGGAANRFAEGKLTDEATGSCSPISARRWRSPSGRPGRRQASSEALLRPQAEDIGDQVILVARAELEIGHAAVGCRHGALEHRRGRLLAGRERGEGWQAVRPARRRRAAHDMAVGAPALGQRLAAQNILRGGHSGQHEHRARKCQFGENPGDFHDPSMERL